MYLLNCIIWKIINCICYFRQPKAGNTVGLSGSQTSIKSNTTPPRASLKGDWGSLKLLEMQQTKKSN